MAALTGTEITLIAVILVLAAILALAGALVLQRLRRRRDQLRGELTGGVGAASDRAFNRIAMARRELGILRDQGADVARANEMVGEAQAAFDLRQFERAYERAQSAHESLVSARQRPLVSSGGPLTVPAPVAATAAGAVGPAEAPPAGTQIPPHRAEAQFQIRLLSDDVTRARAARPSDGRTLAGTGLLNQAQTAYDRAQYAEAFRLALRGRREVGGAIEAVPLVGVPSEGSERSEAPLSPENAAESAAAADRCPSCGHPMLPEEPFCRGCGVPRASSG